MLAATRFAAGEIIEQIQTSTELGPSLMLPNEMVRCSLIFNRSVHCSGDQTVRQGLIKTKVALRQMQSAQLKKST